MAKPLVLVIEDSLADAELARAALAGVSTEVEFKHVTNGEQGLARLSALRETLDPPVSALVLLDLGLPGTDGFALLERMRAAADCIPVVVFSGSDDPAIVRRALRAGANAYLHKPSDVDQFLARVAGIAEAFLVHATPVAMHAG